jgi:iron-sulfur cluster repair protein YtfE (RIC family)
VKHAPAIEPIPTALMAEPLNWLFAEHYRHRQFCALIERIAASQVVSHLETQEALTFLRHDLPLHIVDEEDDLFPLLRRRCEPEDEVDRVLGSLSADHRDDIDVVAQLISLLEASLRLERPPAASPKAQRQLRAFVARERAHIALENAVVLPIARLRLTQEDLDVFSRRMAARRGLPGRSVSTPGAAP